MPKQKKKSKSLLLAVQEARNEAADRAKMKENLTQLIRFLAREAVNEYMEEQKKLKTSQCSQQG